MFGNSHASPAPYGDVFEPGVRAHKRAWSDSKLLHRVLQWPLGHPPTPPAPPPPRVKPRITCCAGGAGWMCVGGLSAAFGDTPAHAYCRWADEEATNPFQ